MSFANGMRQTKRPRSVQTILRIVIRQGRYGADEWDAAQCEYVRNNFMCFAALLARDRHEITPKEYERVVDTISRYLGDRSILYFCMRAANLIPAMSMDEFASTAGRELYWNWNKRPDLTPKL